MHQSLFACLGCLITFFLNIVVPTIALWSLLRLGWGAVRWWKVLSMTMLLSHVGISIGFHRFFSHQSFKTSMFGKWALASIGTLTLQGSPIYWAAQHRLHHFHCEEAADPHSPLHGFWHAHGGFLTGLTGPTVDSNPQWSMRLVSDLGRDPDLSALLHGPLAVAHPVGVMIGIPLASLVIFGSHATLWYLHVPQFLAWHATLSVNSATHTFGYPRTSPSDGSCRARNVPWLFSVLLGEAWHANHHSAAGLASMEGVWFEVDPQFRLLKLAECAGVVWDVRSSSNEHEHPGSWTCVLQMVSMPMVFLSLSVTLRYWRVLETIVKRQSYHLKSQ